MTNQGGDERTLAEEFRLLGENLRTSMHAMWNAPEQQKLRGEISDGLSQIGSSLTEMAEDFRTSETGERIKQEVEDVSDRMKTGEFEQKARSELIKGLEFLNEELSKLKTRWETSPEEAEAEEDAGVQPEG
jgi:hypothetical protein